MDTALFIRRHINLLKDDKPFSIRDFLNYGPRNAVDQVFHRLVKSGRIIRIARGVFIKETSPKPSILDVALTKAKAFGKRLFVHGSQAAFELRLWANPMTEATGGEAVYACDGASSAFRFGDTLIRFINTSARKRSLVNDISLENSMRISNDMRLFKDVRLSKHVGLGNKAKTDNKVGPDDNFNLDNNLCLDNGLAGLTVSALWYLGKTICSEQLVYAARMPFNRHDRQALRQLIKVMPAWLANYFIPSEKPKNLDNRFKALILNAYFP